MNFTYTNKRKPQMALRYFRKQRSNKAQIEYLCKYMHQHKEFAAGEYKTPQGAAQIERQWIQLQAALDELGPHRTVEQWKIVSSVIKYYLLSLFNLLP